MSGGAENGMALGDHHCAAAEAVGTATEAMMRRAVPVHRRISRPVRIALVTIGAVTLLVIGWMMVLNWNWLEPSLRDALPQHQAEKASDSPSGRTGLDIG